MSEDKSVKTEPVVKDDVSEAKGDNLESFFFPTIGNGVAVQAATREEAEAIARKDSDKKEKK